MPIHKFLSYSEMIVALKNLMSFNFHIGTFISVDDIDRVATKLLNNQEKESVENVLIDPRNMGIVQEGLIFSNKNFKWRNYFDYRNSLCKFSLW